MGCTGDREKGPPEETAQWDFLTLSDFKCTSGWNYLAYGWLWFMTLIGVAVYVLDTYTAVNLLVYDHWSSQIQPALAFKYSKWIFAICILLSWALCIYEWIRAMRVIRRGGVAESFLDPLAVTLQSIRPQGGWKRFLVFTELTKSKKGADYVALFVYFAFKGAIRVILAEGPRQAVNAMTLYAVLTADLIPNQKTTRNNFDQFWFNVQSLMDSNPEQAVIYCSMLFTLVIWVFSALSLIISGLLYILFLWHYIPQRDGRLSIYCKRKIDKRLAKIVEHKVKAALEKEERKAQKAERKAELQRKKTGELPLPERPSFKKQPTLPDLGTPPTEKEDKLPEFGLARQDTTSTTATLPLYTSNTNENMQRQPTLPKIDTGARPGMMRTDTQSTGWSAAPSYSTQAPLLANAGYAGGPAEDVPLPPSAVSRQGSYASYQQFHGRTDSQSTQGTRRPFTPGPPPSMRSQTPMSARPYTPGPPPSLRSQTSMSSTGPGYPPRGPPGPRMPPLARTNTGFSTNTGYSFDQTNTSPQDVYSSHFAPPSRSNTADGYRPTLPPQDSNPSFSTLHSQRSFSRPMNGPQPSFNRPFTPAAPTVPESRPVSTESYEMKPQPSHSLPTQPPNTGYVAFNPSAGRSNPSPPAQDIPQRNITVTGAQSTGTHFSGATLDVPQRSVTAPVGETPRNSSYAHDILAEYGSDDEGHAKPLPAAPRSQTPQYRAYGA